MRRRFFLRSLIAAAFVAAASQLPGLAGPDPMVSLRKQRLASDATSYIKQRLSEESFARKILQPGIMSRNEVVAAFSHR